jgi:cation diffusion facilitator family transporter
LAGEGTGHGATVAALAANTGIALAKFVAFVFTGSASMLAEGIHSVADTSNQALLLLGVRRSKRTPTTSHPFGYGRERYFWAFVVAVVLFTVGGVASIIEGIEKLRTPHELSSVPWAFGVLGVSIVLESLSFRVAIREANQTRTTGWWRYIREAKTPEIVVLILEDAGALFGLVFALAGVTIAEITHNARFDAAGSLVIGLLLCTIAVLLAVELRSLLIGEAATPADVRAIEDAIRDAPELRELLQVRTVHIGPDQLLVGSKVRLRPDLRFEEIASVIDAMEARIRAKVPAARFVYIEPDCE